MIQTEPVEIRKTTYRRKKSKKKRNFRLRLLIAVILLILASIFIINIMTKGPKHVPAPTEYQIQFNRTPLKRTAKDIRYIVIHDTDNKDRGADAMRHYRYFNSADQRSSADFFVDDKTVLRVNDYYSYYTWHCGDGNGKNGITNRNSIGVEICVNRDGNYKKAQENAVELVKQLMRELEIDIEHVVTHRDASGKDCPRSMPEKQWEQFKSRLKD